MYEPRAAADIMVTNVLTLSPKTHVLAGIAEILRNRITGAPVVGVDRQYLGVFSEKCCMRILSAISRVGHDSRGNGRPVLKAKDVMRSRLITVSPTTDVFDAIGLLLKHKISGAPVIDENRQYLGVFSEKTSMSVLIAAAVDGLPTSSVAGFTNTDPNRTISPDMNLTDITQMFVDTPYRRLTVLSEGRLVGQISRRDVLQAEHPLARYVRDCDTLLLNMNSRIDTTETGSGGDSVISRLGSTDVASFMDTHAQTITEDVDLLGMAQIFLNTPFRRLPVIRGGRLVGQISRRDVLTVALNNLEFRPRRENSLLYLSSLAERSEVPFS